MSTFTTILSSMLFLYIFVTITLYVLSWTLSPQRARVPAFLARALASLGSLVLCATYGFLASLTLRCVGKAGLSQWTTARAFKLSMWLSTGVWFDIVEGKEYLRNTRPAVFLGNHQSYVETLYLETRIRGDLED